MVSSDVVGLSRSIGYEWFANGGDGEEEDEKLKVVVSDRGVVWSSEW